MKMLMVGDAVSCRSGLGRIVRDVAARIHQEGLFEVATAGYLAPADFRYPWHQPTFTIEKDTWQINELPVIARSFSPDILFFVWDASRLDWVADPQAHIRNPILKQWMLDFKGKKWVYPAVDAEGPNGVLTYKLRQTLSRFDRVLNYSQFSANITKFPDVLPHGIDTDVFKPVPEARKLFRQMGFWTLEEDDFLIGIVATNQERKNWQLGIETAAILKKDGLPVKLWLHVDRNVRNWDIGSLLVDYGIKLQDTAITLGEVTDQQMSIMYSACDVTLGIGNGEGFGYPIFESLACGTPCVHGNYGGAVEHMDTSLLIEPTGDYYESPYSNHRMTYNPRHWARTAAIVAKYPATLPEHLDWNNLWPRWKEWLTR